MTAMILYHLDASGGFTAGDTETGRTAYAYPGSKNAASVKAKGETNVAAHMMAMENDSSDWRDAPNYAARDARIMKTLVQENLNLFAVHHIDGNSRNNDLSNLRLVPIA